MKHKRKIKGKAIALRCISVEGTSLIKLNEIYLGVPSTNHNLFEIYLPKYKYRLSNLKTIPFPKCYFEPINPSHKYNPVYF